MIKRNAKALISAAGPILPYLAAAMVGEILPIWVVLVASAGVVAYFTWLVPNAEE